MDQKHRDHIKKNINELIQETNYTLLMDACVLRGLLSPTMRQNIEQDLYLNGDSEDDRVREKHKKLFLKLTKRGPQAYQMLKQIFMELDMLAAERILSDYDRAHYISISKRQNANKENDVEPTLQNLSIRQRAYDRSQDNDNKYQYSAGNRNSLNNVSATNDIDQKDSQSSSDLDVIVSTELKEESKTIYKMVSKKRGILFMVNNIDFNNPEWLRNGADKDHLALNNVFKKFYFKIYSHKNLGRQAFVTELRKVLSSSEAVENECFVLALMSHGDLNRNNDQVVHFCDGETMNVQEIKDIFKETNCRFSMEKPKVFLFPFCRGSNIEKNPEPVAQETAPQETESIRIGNVFHGLRDALVCYASSHGYRAHRDTTVGNWYIQEFCKVLRAHAHNTDLESMVKQVQRSVNEQKSVVGTSQTCVFENLSFNKQLYFNPGIYKDEKNNVQRFKDEDDLNLQQSGPQSDEDNVVRVISQTPLKFKTDYYH